jgi:hypothetical protein
MTDRAALVALRDAVREGRATMHDFARVFPSESAYGKTTWGTAHNAFSGDIGSALLLVKMLLPGWGWQVGSCHVSDDARVFPDFNCPVHGARLLATYAEHVDWCEVTDIDLRPPGNPARALLLAILEALIQEATE